MIPQQKIDDPWDKDCGGILWDAQTETGETAAFTGAFGPPSWIGLGKSLKRLSPWATLFCISLRLCAST
jgi:hypothetical protein